MKKISYLILLIISPLFLRAQSTGYLRNDTTKVTNAGKAATLVYETATRGHGYYLRDVGNGKLAFIAIDSASVPDVYAHKYQTYTRKQVDSIMALKQGILLYDNAPTSGSTKIVNSGNLYTTLQGYVPNSRTLTINGTSYPLSANQTINITPTYNATAPLSISGNTVSIPKATGGQDGYLGAADFARFSQKQDALLLDSVPILGSNKYVKSGGIWSGTAANYFNKTQLADSLAKHKAYVDSLVSYFCYPQALTGLNDWKFIFKSTGYDKSLYIKFTFESGNYQPEAVFEYLADYNNTPTEWRQLTPIHKEGVVLYDYCIDVFYDASNIYGYGVGYLFRYRRIMGTAAAGVSPIKVETMKPSATHINIPIFDNVSHTPDAGVSKFIPGIMHNLNDVYDAAGNHFIKSGVIQSLLPKQGALYCFGDSQTWGQNYGTSFWADTTTHRLLDKYWWPHELATNNSRNLTVNNFAWSGSRLSYDPAASTDPGRFSHFNMTGNLPYNWTGLVTGMCGWNNLDAAHIDTAYFSLLQSAHQAMIARFLIDDWAGVTAYGWPRNGGSGSPGAYSWATTGTSDNSQAISDGSAYFSYQYGFPVSTGPFTSRFRTALTSGQYVQFTLTHKRAIALFYETASSGGTFDVLINGTKVTSGNNLYTQVATNDVGQFTKVVWIENAPDSAIVKLVSTNTGTVYFMAFGWVDKASKYLKDRRIIYGSTSGNTYGKSDSVLYRNAVAAENAVASFSSYPVYFAAPYNSWIQSTDSDPQDAAHFTPWGSMHVADAFEHPYKPIAKYNSEVLNYTSSTSYVLASSANQPNGYLKLDGSGKANYSTAHGLNALDLDYKQARDSAITIAKNGLVPYTGATSYVDLGTNAFYSGSVESGGNYPASDAAGFYNSSPTGRGMYIDAGSATSHNADFYDYTSSNQIAYILGTKTYTAADSLALITKKCIDPIKLFYADAANTGTTETDLYTYTIPGNTVNYDGKQVIAKYSVNILGTGGSKYLRAYFAGTALNLNLTTAAANTEMEVTIIRTSATTARALVRIAFDNASVRVTETDLTGLNFTIGNILKITGMADAGTGGEITAKFGKIKLE
jgi:hypothetical protein